MSWIHWLDDMAAKNYEKVAIFEQVTERTLTYSQLKEEVDKWAWWFKERGIAKGDRVAFMATNCLEHLVLFFACARLGAIFVPMNWRLSVGEILEIYDRIEPSMILTKGECTLDHPYDRINLDNIVIENCDRIEWQDIEMEQPLLMLFTSGTTGKPKGVLLHGEMLAANQKHTCRGWGLLNSDISMVETPFFHTGGYNVTCLPLLSIGGKLILAEKFEADNVFTTIEKEKVSIYFGVPTMFQMLAENPDFEHADFSSIRFFISGGAACSVDLIQTYAKKNLVFKQGFGMTEVGPNCFVLDEKYAISKIGSIGKPMVHSEVLLVGENGEPVRTDEVGELLIRGPHLCAGYYGQRERFESCLHGGFFKTGDLAKRDIEGFYTIVGRKKDMYISGGENVYPAEVEKKILDHETIHDAVVVSIPEEKWGEVGLAFIRSESDVSIEKMREFLNSRLSRYKHPHYVVRKENFPVLANGKIDRQLLKREAMRMKNEGELHVSRNV